MQDFATFLHKRGAIKAATVPCLARSILFTEINKFMKYLQEAQLTIIEQKRQEEATREYNDKIKNYYPNLPATSKTALAFMTWRDYQRHFRLCLFFNEAEALRV